MTTNLFKIFTMIFRHFKIRNNLNYNLFSRNRTSNNKNIEHNIKTQILR